MEASGIGRKLLRLCHQDLGSVRADLVGDLRPVGKELHLVETMPVCHDAGVSIRAILDRVLHNYERLEGLVQPVEASGRGGAA